MVDSSPKLYAYKNSTNLLKIQAVARASNVTLEVVTVNNQIMPNATVEGSPTNSYPYLETNGVVISETAAILQFVASKGSLAPENDTERSQISQWQFFSAQEIANAKRNTVYPIFGYLELNEKDNKADNERLKNHLKSLEKHLTGRTYLLGTKLTCADFDLWANLKHLWQLVYVEQMRTKLYPNIDAWFVRLANHEAVLGVFGITLLCKVAQKAPKVEKKVEEKKEEKKIEKSKKEADGEEDDDEKPKKEKAPEFPESSMDFDGFKKDFMNSTDRKSVLDNFFSTQYDPKGFSIYYTRYQKLPTECKEFWKTENGHSLFIQKIDAYRKFAFAAFGIYGVEGDYEIRGVWMWRGLGVPFFMEQHESFDYYDRQLLNPAIEEDRKIIDSYWLSLKAGETVQGLPVAKVETFK